MMALALPSRSVETVKAWSLEPDDAALGAGPGRADELDFPRGDGIGGDPRPAR